MPEYLTQSDVSKLLKDKSEGARADAARKLGAQLQDGVMTASERRIAEDILRLMVNDAELRVREALSQSLKNCMLMPHDVAMSLARDEDTVALPILEASRLLTDDDLIEIIDSHNAAKQIAISTRKAVSAIVCDALIETKVEEAVSNLAANEGARITEKSMQRILDNHGDSERVQSGLTHRAKLPVTVSERLVTMVSEKLRDHLMSHHEFDPDVAADLILQVRERAVTGLLSPNSPERDVERLVKQLHDNDRLTPSLILRALCTGDMVFFEASLARRANVPTGNAQILIHDSGALGLMSLFEAANLPSKLYPAVQVAVHVADELQAEGAGDDRETFSRRMIERILTQYEEIESTDLEYILDRLSRLAGSDAPAPVIH